MLNILLKSYFAELIKFNTYDILRSTQCDPSFTPILIHSYLPVQVWQEHRELKLNFIKPYDVVMTRASLYSGPGASYQPE